MNAVVERRAVILNPQRISLAEQWRQDWVVNAEESTTIDDVLDPGYWAHTAGQMQKFDRVEVRLETGEWIADLIVVDVGRNWASMHLIQKHELEKPSAHPAMAAKHEVLWKGPHLKFCVVRLSDKEILQSGMEKNAAIVWLQNYEQTIQG